MGAGGGEEQAIRLACPYHPHTLLWVEKSSAKCVMVLLIAGRRIISGSAQNRAPSCHPRKKTLCDGTRPELRLTTAAAQRRIISVARIRLDPAKSVRPFKGIICADVFEFESHMPSRAVGLSAALLV